MEQFPGRIHIGGTLRLKPPRGRKRLWGDAIERFISLLADESPDTSGGEPSHDVDPAKPLSLRKIAKEKGVIICDNFEASGGEFSELEEVCQILGLSYDRWTDSREYEGEYVRYRPGMKKPFVCEANNESVPVVDRDPVLEAYNLLNEMEDENVLSGPDNIKAARIILMKSLYTGGEVPVEPENLQPFKVAP